MRLRNTKECDLALCLAPNNSTLFGSSKLKGSLPSASREALLARLVTQRQVEVQSLDERGALSTLQNKGPEFIELLEDKRCVLVGLDQL